MRRYAFDCAWAPFPSPAEAKANGFEGMIRYLAPQTLSMAPKTWTKQQIVDAHGAGLWTLGVWETTADRAGHGSDAGAQDVSDAEAQWAALGAPPGTTIFYAVDYDPDPAAVMAYFHAVRAGSHFKVGAYCSDGVAVHLFNAQLIDFFWQTESTGFRGRWPSPIAHLIQHVGYQRPKMTGDYDENTVIATEFGQWWPVGHGLVTDEEDDMLVQVKKGDAAVFLPLRGKAGRIRVANDFGTATARIATGVDGNPGAVRQVKKLSLNRSSAVLLLRDETWASVLSEDGSFAVSVEYS